MMKLPPNTILKMQYGNIKHYEIQNENSGQVVGANIFYSEIRKCHAQNKRDGT